MTVYVEIITSPNCIHSPKAVRLITNLTKNSKNIIVKEVSLLTNEGQERAEGYDIESTPSIAINGELICEGLPEKGEIKKLLDEFIYKEKERVSYFF
ncbi:thioredoxin family protein [Candidatus Micrarchaeota archaeon]|nr:thioredoxin family protein [Candidatus Micrarchaeota archaeon]